VACYPTVQLYHNVVNRLTS